jgi:uncharacterized protein
MKLARRAKILGLVLKTASRCNLNCTYCYVYNHADKTYRQQPPLMSDDTVDHVVRRVGDYCRHHRSRSFQFVFHGGEPLLAPPLFYQRLVGLVGRSLPAYTRVRYALQTNAVLLTDAWCQTLGELDIRLGISLDEAAAHDQYRVDHRGRGSYEAAVAGLRRAQQHPALRYYPGVLAVIDPLSNPRQFLEQLLRLEVRVLNLLLPDGTHHVPPPHLPPGTTQTPYADWLIGLFDAWFAMPAARRPRIRFFQEIISLILGFDTSAVALGRTDNLFLVIETDGCIEAEDSLKVCQHGITKEGMHVRLHSLDEALDAPLIARCAETPPRLPTACQRCPIGDVCGGGFIVHRYHPGSGFDNPSVYCRDLMKLITHIQNQLITSLPVSFVEKGYWQPVSFEQVLGVLAGQTYP